MLMTDISLILEGTYPYRTGGVATWTDRLVHGLPEFTFSVAHLYYGEEPEFPKFEIPENLKTITNISLNKVQSDVTMDDLVESLPHARLYHSLSTGIAGMLGTEVKLRKQLPFLLTEHGIYWHEVALGVDELECGFKIVRTEHGELLLGKTWKDWNDTFRDLARKAYTAADVITTVCSFNQSLQRSLGALPSKSFVIPNGAAIPANGRSRPRMHESKSNVRIALVARVSPIKDVKTFLRACAIVQQNLADAEFFVIGAKDHDRQYTAECMELVDELLLRRVVFTGEVNVEQFYPTIDIVVLTSVSEAQPLVVLEAFAHGIPVVTTDVGGLPELVKGNNPSQAPAGILCPVANPASIAAGIVRLCSDGALYRTCAQAGLARVTSAYSAEAVLRSYGTIYHNLLDQRD
jgi:glycosyltransferase involved in cell wall biosynthesis